MSMNRYQQKLRSVSVVASYELLCKYCYLSITAQVLLSPSTALAAVLLSKVADWVVRDSPRARFSSKVRISLMVASI